MKRSTWLVVLSLLLMQCTVATPYSLVAQQANTKNKIPPARQVYKGRRIARTMHYEGAPWLIRENREQQERCSLMLANLGVKPGMTVCDMGCGNGFYSLPLAKMVGEEGQVLAVDVQPEMLKKLRDRSEAKGIENIIPILGSFHNPRLPKGQVDLILLVDVYHEFSHPETMLKAMLRSLSPQGMIVLLEYREEDPKVPILPLHKMSKQQIMKELPPNGYKLVKEFDGVINQSDLDLDSPYNTYLYAGLPPGPIANPGLQSIEAALYPADVDYLYFVSTNDASHFFSINYRDHNRAVEKYQR